MILMATTARDESDYDSSCSSSITVPGSSRSWMSNPSFGSRRSSVSVDNKPHKANHASWEAMRRLRRDLGGQVGLDSFRLLRRLGSGDLGNVYLCQMRTGPPAPGCLYAMKVVDREALAIRKKLQRAEMEKEILSVLDHPFLPTLYAEFDASHYSCLVMEFCPGGDLHNARQRQPGKRFPISSAKFYAAEILLAIEYLHMMGIVYRDLKPENVLIRDDGHIMLSDFDLSLKCDVVPKLITSKPTNPSSTDNDDDEITGAGCSTPTCLNFSPSIRRTKLTVIRSSPTSSTTTTTTSTRVTEEVDRRSHRRPEGNNSDRYFSPELVAEPINARSKSFVGTHEYLAPEVISGQGHGGAVDWWTFGVFLYELLYGTTPFKGENNERTLINILKQQLTFPRIGVNTRKEYEEIVRVQDLIRRLLVKNPRQRIGSSKGSVEIKGHDFFRDVNWPLIRSVRPPEVPADVHNRMRMPTAVRRRMAARAPTPKVMSRKERDEPYQINQQYYHHCHHRRHHFDYF